MLLDKQTREPAPSIAAGVPDDLSALSMKLLRFDPAQRPTATEVLRSPSVAGASGVTLPRGSSETPIFVGRGLELEGLREAFEATTQGKLATALVCGESGIGKSYLVRRFTGLLLADRPETVLLEGRCYERETVPYKTLDGIVDALSRRLSRMSPSEVAALLPTRCATLAQVFPVMLRVPQVAKEHAAVTLSAEPHELRQRAFVALRELFTRVAVRRPTVVVIDDLQWADDDGLRALGHDDARALAVAFLKRGDAGDADPEIIASEASTLDLLRDGATGLVHEQLIARSFAIIALANLGRFRELCRLQDESLREGLARGDVYVTISMKTGFANLAWLVADRPDVAEIEVRDAMAGWSASGFHTEHYHALLAHVHLLLYDEAVEADAVARDLFRRTKGSSLWRIQAVRLFARHVHVATASSLLQKGRGDRDALVRRVALGAQAIEREQMAWALPFVMLARARLALGRAARDEAILGLDDAARGFDAVDMAAYAAATRDRVARLRGDASAAVEIERAAAFFRGEGVEAPARFIAMLVPGFPA